MGEAFSEVLTSFLIQQAQIWTSVSEVMSDELGMPVQLPTPTVQVISISDLASVTNSPSAQLQFTFSESPGETYILRVQGRNRDHQENLQALIEAFTGTAPEAINEATSEGIRPFLESIANGLAVTLSQLRGTPFTPADLSFSYDALTLPPDFLNEEEVFEVCLQVPLGEESPPAELVWLLRENSVRQAVGLPPQKDETALLFAEPLDVPETAPSAQVPVASPAAMPPMETPAAEPRSLDLLLDVPLEISVELGRVEMLVRDVLELGSGSIIELQKAAGEPVDVLVNGRLIARGEVVVVEDNFGVRITEVLTPSERLQRLSA